MAKRRTPIPDDVAAAALFASDRTCCICRERGRPVQIHHIDENPTNHDLRNLAVLCLICHNETQVRGGFGRTLRPPEVIKSRDAWLETVIRRRQLSDEAAVVAGLGAASLQFQPDRSSDPIQPGLEGSDAPSADRLIDGLPGMLVAAKSLAEDGWDTGNTLRMTEATWDVVSVVADMWVRLARRYPAEHFGDQDLRDFFEDHLRRRGDWHHLIVEPGGLGTGGTIVRIVAAAAMLKEAERMVEDTVAALWSYEDAAGLDRWREAWRQATEKF